MTRTSAQIAYKMLCKLIKFMRKEFTHRDTILFDKLCDVQRLFESLYNLKES